MRYQRCYHRQHAHGAAAVGVTILVGLVLVVVTDTSTAPATMAASSTTAPAIYAHRGGDPDNSAVAFDAAIRDGWHVEADVRLSLDGVPYLAHDDVVLQPRCNRTLRISATPSRVLRWVRCDGQPLATLPWLVDRLSQPDAVRVRLLVEPKGGTPAEADVILAAVAPLGERVTVESFVWPQLRYVEQVSPATRTCALWTYGTPTADALAEPVDALCPWHGVIDDQVLNDGREVIAWVVDDPDVAAALAARGVAGLISDDPAQVAA